MYDSEKKKEIVFQPLVRMQPPALPLPRTDPAYNYLREQYFQNESINKSSKFIEKYLKYIAQGHIKYLRSYF